MKASFYTESILYWLARGVSFVSQRVPARLNTVMGAGMGILLHSVLHSRRVMALASLKAAFGSSLDSRDYRRIIKKMFRNLGMTFMEVTAIPGIGRKYVERWVSIAPESRNRLEKALAQGKGVIFLAAHFGNWELSSITAALHGYPMLVLARQQGWPKLNRLLTQYRESKGCRVVTKGFPIRQLIRGLQEGRIVGILADQDGGRKGILRPLFDRVASTAPGTFDLSLRTGAPILPVFMIRQQGPAHLLVVEEPLSIPEEGTREERVRQGVAAYLSVLERTIRQYPDQWLWLHRRWKSTPERRVLLLSDGKPGHRAQLLGFAERLEAAWKARTADDPRVVSVNKPLVSVKTVEVRFRHPLLRGILSLAASLVPRRFSGGDAWLRWSLTPDSYRALQSASGDFSISCGVSTAAVNLLWAWGIRARTVHLMLTRFPSWSRFDLSVVPRHDCLPDPASRKVFLLDGALSPCPNLRQDQLDQWRKRLGLSKARQIGCFLGGSTRGISLDLQEVRRVIQSLIAAAEKTDAEILVTSSRRTSAETEKWLETVLGSHPRCRLLTLVNRSQTGGLSSTAEAVPCILGLAEALVVSGDSISMVSEAAGQAKPVVTFLPKSNGRFGHVSKHQKFLQQMDAQGKVSLVEANEVGEAVVRRMKEGNGKTHHSSAPDPLVEFLKKWL